MKNITMPPASWLSPWALSSWLGVEPPGPGLHLLLVCAAAPPSYLPCHLPGELFAVSRQGAPQRLQICHLPSVTILSPMLGMTKPQVLEIYFPLA